MRKQYLALAAVLGMGMFALANPEAGAPASQANVVEVTTVMFCEEYQDGRMVEFVCQGGFTDAINDILEPLWIPLPGEVPPLAVL
ncbi:MAG: hypothetical protein J4F45_00675 [Pseudomonadales bacterium]|nr:hypothetical protein [Pseudomonadales bacterium]